MATQEFYIRNETDTDARGPFSHEQLSSLAENGQVTAETLYYEATSEQWVAVGTNAELMAQLFPEKKKLKMRSKETFKSLNVQPENARPIEVNDMLAAAEGRTSDTKDKADPSEALAKAAKLGMYVLTAILLISATGLLLPFADRFASGNLASLVTQPLALLGVIDLILFVLLALGVVAVYPFVRFRAALGLGFLAFIFWTQGAMMPFAAVLAGSAGLYLCTVFTQPLLLGIASLAGLAGTAAVTYYLVT
ncbi:hypothetical protein MASR2M8_00300 [Opitutaceae bacterium]